MLAMRAEETHKPISARTGMPAIVTRRAGVVNRRLSWGFGHFAAFDGPQGAVQTERDAVADKVYRAVHKGELHAAGVGAGEAEIVPPVPELAVRLAIIRRTIR